VAVHGWTPCGLRGGLLRCARNDGMVLAMTGWCSQRRATVSARPKAVAVYAALSLRGVQRRGSPLEFRIKQCLPSFGPDDAVDY